MIYLGAPKGGLGEGGVIEMSDQRLSLLGIVERAALKRKKICLESLQVR